MQPTEHVLILLDDFALNLYVKPFLVLNKIGGVCEVSEDVCDGISIWDALLGGMLDLAPETQIQFGE